MFKSLKKRPLLRTVYLDLNIGIGTFQSLSVWQLFISKMFPGLPEPLSMPF